MAFPCLLYCNMTEQKLSDEPSSRPRFSASTETAVLYKCFRKTWKYLAGNHSIRIISVHPQNYACNQFSCATQHTQTALFGFLKLHQLDLKTNTYMHLDKDSLKSTIRIALVLRQKVFFPLQKHLSQLS